MKMQMPDGEIITCYRQAKDKEEQIGILADRNLCKKSQMREYLITLGLDVPVKKRHMATGVPKKPPMDEIRAMELYREGQNDLGIAETLGESVNRVREWRYRMRLKANRTRRAEQSRAEQSRAEQSAAFFEEPPDAAAMEKEEGETVSKQKDETPAVAEMTETPTADGGESSTQMTLETLIRVLQNVEKGFPEGKVLVCGSELSCVYVSVTYGRTGAVEGVVVQLFG